MRSTYTGEVIGNDLENKKKQQHTNDWILFNLYIAQGLKGCDCPT